jgi:hypothetical protein
MTNIQFAIEPVSLNSLSTNNVKILWQACIFILYLYFLNLHNVIYTATRHQMLANQRLGTTDLLLSVK